MKAKISAFVAGMVFSCGLLLSGMADPARILGFFDLFGTWDPTLAFVMGGGLSVSVLGYGWCARRAAPLCADGPAMPALRTELDVRLVLGSAVFGLGWGIAGYCPAPALVAGAAGITQAVWFSLAMAAGMLAWKLVESRLGAPQGNAAAAGRA